VSEPITAPHIFMPGLLNRVREPAKGRADSLFTSGGGSTNAQKNNQVQALANDQTPLTTIQKVCHQYFWSNRISRASFFG
jgi:hypothetical protein